MKHAASALAALALSACDGLSVAEKKPQARVAPVAIQPAQDARPADAALEANKLLAGRVKQALEQDENALAAGIDVTADAGAVTLWGTTPSADERARVGRVALEVEGVKSLDNRIAIVKGS